MFKIQLTTPRVYVLPIQFCMSGIILGYDLQVYPTNESATSLSGSLAFAQFLEYNAAIDAERFRRFSI